MKKEDKEFLASIKHGVIAFKFINKNEIDIVHFVGFINKPTEENIKELEEELNNDPSFDFTFGQIGKSIFLMEATSEMIEYFKTKTNKINIHCHNNKESAEEKGGKPV